MDGFHKDLASAVLLLGVVGALWALLCVARSRVSPSLRAYLRLTEVAIAIQAVVGILLVITGHRPGGGLHWFYGPAVLLSLPVAWSIGRPHEGRAEAVTLLAGTVAVFLFSIRAIGTGM